MRISKMDLTEIWSLIKTRRCHEFRVSLASVNSQGWLRCFRCRALICSAFIENFSLLRWAVSKLSAGAAMRPMMLGKIKSRIAVSFRNGKLRSLRFCIKFINPLINVCHPIGCHRKARKPHTSLIKPVTYYSYAFLHV